jgi:hypothetical protein
MYIISCICDVIVPVFLIQSEVVLILYEDVLWVVVKITFVRLLVVVLPAQDATGECHACTCCGH